MRNQTRIYEKEDGRFLLDYGSGRESLGLLIISPAKRLLGFYLNPEVHPQAYEGLPVASVNIGGFDLVAYRGRLFTTKKGREAFELREDGQHLLVCEGWECDRNYRPLLNPFMERVLFHHIWESNGGGAGLLSAVFAADESFTLTEDEL